LKKRAEPFAIDEKGKPGRLSAAVAHIESQFGKGSVMKLGSRTAVQGIDVVSTGSLGLDIALGTGGLPKGRVVEIYGPESSGKTTLAFHVLKEAQKAGGTCAFIDAEHAVDAEYAAKLGVDIDDLYISQPNSGEEALEIGDILVKSGAIDVIVVDSVAALVPQAELDGEMGDSHVALQARLMNQALRKLTGSLHRSNCLMIFINQIRMKVGVIFGSPEVTSGGKALPYFSSVRLDIRRTKAIKAGDETIGTEAKVKIAKNKLAPPFREARFDMMFAEGIDKHGELVDLGVETGFMKKSGAWYSFVDEPAVEEGDEDLASDIETAVLQAGTTPGDSFAQGRTKAKQFLKDNQDVAEAIEAAIRRMNAIGVTTANLTDHAEEDADADPQ
jgi:recombination protein RecA